MTDPVIIVGAGVGGLSAAVHLASRGVAVQVIEAAPGPGGKAGVVVHEGVQLDTGPSVLTLPEVFDRLFIAAGTSLAEQVTLRRPDPAFRYHYADGVVLDMHHDLEASVQSVRRTLGSEAGQEFARFLSYAEEIWEAGAPNFVLGPAPGVGALMRLGLTRLADLRRIDGMRSMWAAIHKKVRSQHLRWLLARYATYNGSSVFSAPATLNCIAWVELGLGGFGVQGGIYALIQALVRVAEGLGVSFRFDTPVERVVVEGGRAIGVQTAEGLVRAEAVIANADAAHVREDLLEPRLQHALPRLTAPSTSGYNTILKARLGDVPRPAHAVLFPKDYEQEFNDLFDHGRPPVDPTVYLCAQSVCHGRAHWPGAEPLFLMANAPAEPEGGSSDPQTWVELEASILQRVTQAGLVRPDDPVVWRRSPTDLARRFSGSRGALYGAASNSALAAFQRPANRVAKVPGLYLASGSAHPGGGLPLCSLSGSAAAEALMRQHGLQAMRGAS